MFEMLWACYIFIEDKVAIHEWMNPTKLFLLVTSTIYQRLLGQKVEKVHPIKYVLYWFEI